MKDSRQHTVDGRQGERKLKKTEIGEIPEEWEAIRLGDKKISEDIFYGITAKATEQNTGLKILRTTDIKDYSVDWDKLPFCEITERRNNLDRYFLKRGDIAIARAGTVGVSVLVGRDLNNVIFGSYLIKVKLKPSAHPQFIHYFLQSNLYWTHIKKAQGSTLKNINLPLLKSLYFPLPPLPEQKKIAEILSTVDEGIEKVDQAIEKTERLKKGLMQELFAKGIPSRQYTVDGRQELEGSRQYTVDGRQGERKLKKTEIGEIPEDWEVAGLGNQDIVKLIMGQSPPSSTYNKTGLGLPFLQGKAEFGDIYPTPGLFCSAPAKVAQERDILISVRAPVGDVNIAPSECCIGRGLAAIRVNGKRLHHLLLFYYLKLKKEKIESMSSGSTFKAVKRDDIERLTIPIPPLSEQKKIAEILSTVDKRLELLRKRRERLERVKKGLMNDLLTGKKRVAV